MKTRKMTKAEEMAADYWIANTDAIYKLDLHISSPVMDAFKAGFEAGVASVICDVIDEDVKTEVQDDTTK